MAQPTSNDQPSEQELDFYAAETRKSLIARLDNWEDQRTWDDFYKTYWKLIYSVATKSGLSQEESWDVVQETILYIAKQSKRNMYDPQQGSFKSWLWRITRWRITDQLRKNRKNVDFISANKKVFSNGEEWIDNIADETQPGMDELWETEWQNNILHSALARVKEKVSPKQYQIFDYYVLKEWDAKEVSQFLKVPLAQVYLTKHRVGSVLKKEMTRLIEESKD